MAWQDDATEVLRVLVNDMDSPQTYSDDKLERVLVVAAFQVLLEATFSQDFVVSISNASILPDPTLGAGKDESFVNLFCLKSACIIDRGGAVAAAQRAISVRDGSSAVDLRGVFGAKLQLLEKGWCAVYEDSKLDYQAGRSRVAGAAIVSPFRLFATGGYGGYLGSDRNRDLLF